MKRSRATSSAGRAFSVVALSAVVALSLAACGSGSASDGSTASSAASTSAAAGTTASSGSATSAGGSAATGSSSGSATGSAGSAGAGGDAVAAACEGVSGPLRHWATTDAEVFKQEIEPFTTAYPDIEVQFTSYRPNDAIQQVLTQVQTGRDLEVDSLAMSVPYVGPLLDNNLIATTDWTALGVPSDQILDIGNGITLYRNYRMLSGLVYNADLVQESELPKTWDELVDAKWQGKVVVDPRGTYLSRLAVAWGAEQTVSWYENLMNTVQPLVVQGATASLQKVAAGEALMSTSAHDSEVLEQQAAGAPLEIKYLDVVPTQDYYSFIVQDSPNAAAAKCFLAWFASDEGQAQQLEFEYKANQTEPENLPAGSEVANIETIEDATLVADVGTELATITGGGGG
jgi:iron(III) transport system substrate-binding protein